MYKKYHKNGAHGKQCEGWVVLYKNETEVMRRHFETRWRRTEVVKNILRDKKKFRQLYGEGQFHYSITLNL